MEPALIAGLASASAKAGSSLANTIASSVMKQKYLDFDKQIFEYTKLGGIPAMANFYKSQGINPNYAITGLPMQSRYISGNYFTKPSPGQFITPSVLPFYGATKASPLLHSDYLPTQ